MESIVTAWDVYWVMQLDSIGGMLLFLSLAMTILSAVIAIPVALERDDAREGSDRHASLVRAHKSCVKWLVVGAMLLSISSLIPSSKTAAAMILLPAITSDQVIEPVGVEARELYTLAKQALRNVVEKKAEPEPKKD